MNTQTLPLYIDIHAHINDARFNEDRREVLARMREHKVYAIMVGTDYKSSQNVAMMASFADEGVYASIGVHPNDKIEPFRKEFFEDLMSGKGVVAIGECGLDYSHLMDVPNIAKEKKRQSDILRQLLKRIKCLQLQKSVYITPFNCDDEIEYIRHLYSIGDNVKILKVSSIENEKAYREYFGI